MDRLLLWIRHNGVVVVCLSLAITTFALSVASVVLASIAIFR